MNSEQITCKILPYATFVPWIRTLGYFNNGDLPGWKTSVPLLEASSKALTSRGSKYSNMIQFFQVLFFTAAVVLIVLNVLDFNKYRDGKKDGANTHPVKWFNFILTSLVAIGCVLNILIGWIKNG